MDWFIIILPSKTCFFTFLQIDFRTKQNLKQKKNLLGIREFEDIYSYRNGELSLDNNIIYSYSKNLVAYNSNGKLMREYPSLYINPDLTIYTLKNSLIYILNEVHYLIKVYETGNSKLIREIQI